MIFKDRVHAGILLSEKFKSQTGAIDCVIGLARGGVIVADALAHALAIPLDVLVVSKIPSPGNPEVALGALAPNGIRSINWRRAAILGADEVFIQGQIATIDRLITKRIQTYRKGKKPLAVQGKTILLVDDGAATGATMETAIRWCKTKKAKHIYVGLPVAHEAVIRDLAPEVRQCVIFETPRDFGAVGQYYEDFRQVTDEDVLKCLKRPL